MNTFQRVSLKTKVFEKAFDEKTAAGKELSFTATGVSNSGATPLRFYECNGDTFVYCTNGALYSISNGAFTATGFTSVVSPLVLPVMKNGLKKTMFVGNPTAVIDGETVTGVPCGKSGAFCGGRLFIADGNKIKYSEEFDFTDFSVGLSFGGFIETDDDAGEILFLAEEGGKLYAVARRAAFELEPYGEPFAFKLSKICSFRSAVVSDSAVCSGGAICFVYGKDFTVLSGGKSKRVGGALRSVADFTSGIAGATNGLYTLPITAGGNSYVYAYDLDTGAEILQAVTDFTVSDGRAVKAGETAVYIAGVKEDAAIGTENYSGEYDFGTCAKKAVCGIEAHISGNCRVTVTGDGTFTATLTEKCNSVPCFVHGKNFTITFGDASAGFRLYKLAVRYVVYGE